MSILNARSNPDIIVPGVRFLKGNLYIKQINNDEEMKNINEETFVKKKEYTKSIS